MRTSSSSGILKITAKGTTIAAVLPRADVHDVLIHKGKLPGTEKFVIATSSIRRRSQWLERFPHHEAVNIRGNVETRIQKLNESDFDGLIMAKAAIDRLEMKLPHTLVLDWMLPAPGQGALAIQTRSDDDDILGLLAPKAGSFRIRPIHPFADQPAKRVLVRALKTGKAPLVLLPALVLHDREGGKHRADAEAVLRGEAGLVWG